MAFKMRGFSGFTKTDPPKKEKEIKEFIKNNMGNMSDKDLMKKINSMSDGKTEYNWNPETGAVESHKTRYTKEDRKFLKEQRESRVRKRHTK